MLTRDTDGKMSHSQRASTFRLSSIFEQCPLAIVVYDRTLQIIASNDAMARLVGVPRARIEGLHIDHLRDQRHRLGLERALAGETATYDSPYQATQSDAWFWASVTFAPLRDDRDAVIAAMCVIDAHPPWADGNVSFSSDVQLGEAQRLGRVGSWTWDIGRERAAASPELYRILGVASAHQINLATEFERFIHLDDRRAVRRHVEETLRAERAFATCEFRIVRADGAERSVVLRAEVKYGDDGRASIAWGTVQDVTERRELEEQLRRAQRMEALGQLASGVAHDFNNLLTVIGLEADSIDEALPLNHPLHEEVREVRLAVDRAGGLTRQLLAFSRRQLLRPSPVDLNQLVTETSTMLRRLLGENVELVTNLRTGVPRAFADPGQLQQVLVNLAVNARDAMPNGGKLLIATGVTAIARDATLPAGDYVMLTVADTGHGIEHSLQQRIFDPFFTTKPPGKGTGLGLSTVLGIVEQSGGSIVVKSQTGRGTRFTIRLPPAPAGAAFEHAEDRATHPRTSHRKQVATILLVEDETPLRGAAQRVLEREGYTVLSADDAHEAVVVAEGFSGKIDLLVTDMVLPGFPGRELAARLLRTRPKLRILYMTGYGDEVASSPGSYLDAAFVLEKPFNFGQLADAVLLALVGDDNGAGG